MDCDKIAATILSQNVPGPLAPRLKQTTPVASLLSKEQDTLLSHRK